MIFFSWARFDWYNENSKVYVGDYYFKCGGSSKIDRKIIFPLKQLKKHLTLSISKKRLDLHLTSDNKGKKNHKSILKISSKTIKKVIKKHIKPASDIEFFPYNSKSLKKLFFVNPNSKQFLSISVDLRNIFDIHPAKLLKLRIKNMDRLHGNVLFVYDKMGRFKGMVKYNHRKYGFEIIPALPLKNIFSSVLNRKAMINSLIAEDLKYNHNSEYQWKIWLQCVEKIESIKPFFYSYILRIIRLRNTTNP